MTAEIAILNRSGIALAADSAVTVGEQKVYNSANKLFTLSKYHPVGIMVYNKADLLDIPWEIVIKEYRAQLGKKTLESIKEKLIKDGQALSQKFSSDLNDFTNLNNIKPIVNMVTALPKDELAAMAEALVNLTVFKTKVSKAVETVGGPIDVAVISKGDGFIWVKRKHYFKPELNQHFLSNYFKESQ